MYAVAPVPGDALLDFFYRSTWINVLAWGVGYLVAAFVPASRAAVLLAGAAGKAAYFVACVALVTSGVGRPLVLARLWCRRSRDGAAVRRDAGAAPLDGARRTEARMTRNTLDRLRAGIAAAAAWLADDARSGLLVRMACAAAW
jgi:hypothetical protein